VLSAVATTTANTLTGVLIVPELTVTTTCPFPAETADEVVRPLAKVIPPTVVLNEKLTVWFGIGLPPVSTTSKITWEVSCRPAPPVPFRVMFVGSEWSLPWED
jgi:hypothetical protein